MAVCFAFHRRFIVQSAGYSLMAVSICEIKTELFASLVNEYAYVGGNPLFYVVPNHPSFVTEPCPLYIPYPSPNLRTCRNSRRVFGP